MPERSAIMCVTQIVDEQKVGFLVLKSSFLPSLFSLRAAIIWQPCLMRRRL